MHNHTPDERAARVPTIHVVSDSIGETAQVVARAAAAQFGVTNPRLEVFSKITPSWMPASAASWRPSPSDIPTFWLWTS